MTDRRGTTCTHCKTGMYREMYLQDDLRGVLHCDKCNDEVQRYFQEPLPPKVVKRIYVDMDDTLCNFTSAYRLARTQNPGILFPQSQYGFFRKLHPIDGAAWFMQKLSEEHDVWIATRPSVFNPLCYSEKREWVERHLGMEWCHKLIIIPDKSLLKGDLLIDDQPWPAFEGKQILFGAEPYETWRKVYIAMENDKISF